MIIKEFRVILPMSVEEYHVAQLYAVAEASKHETGGKDGVEVLVNEPFNSSVHPPSPPLLSGDPRFITGQYTHKCYHLYHKVPRLVQMLAPTSSLVLTEHAWNAYPYCRTILTNNYLADRLNITIESMHSSSLDIENAHDLKPEELKMREVIIIDIGAYDALDKDRTPEFDPTLFKSQKTGRGPLAPEWWKTYNGPIMCAYKLVRARCNIVMLGSRIEDMIQRQEKRLFTHFHRQVFCWMDQWYGLTLADIRKLEEQTKRELDAQRLDGSVRGHVAEE